MKKENKLKKILDKMHLVLYKNKKHKKVKNKNINNNLKIKNINNNTKLDYLQKKVRQLIQNIILIKNLKIVKIPKRKNC